MTKEWAAQLVSLGYPAELPLTFDRLTGAVVGTLGELAASADGEYEETFHFVLNNYVAKDNRIPPYGMDFDEAPPKCAARAGRSVRSRGQAELIDVGTISPSALRRA
jgi:hypothetical protein